jgi:ankyrin repeat protein
MERLIKHGVSPNVSDYGDRTPLHIAAAEGDLELATFLVNHGANVLAKDR